MIVYMLNKNWWSQRFPMVNALLLLLVIFPIFIIPSLPRMYTTYLYPPFFTVIFLCAAFSITRHRKIIVFIAVIINIFFWLSYLGESQDLKLMIRLLEIFFFLFMVGALVREISTTPTVSSTVLMDAVTAYLLLGFAFSLLVTVVYQLIPGAYNFVGAGNEKDYDPIRQNIYYAFVTFTTTGYGDILPVAPVAKSLAILISISGQLYIAIIMALLVGKFASARH